VSESAIALNRFGLGGRRGENAPAEPRRWLLDQLARFDPRPPAIAALPGSAAMVMAFSGARMDQAMARRERKQQAATGLPGEQANPAMRARDLREGYAEAAATRTNVALVSSTPFVERLVHFWANHFAVSVDKQATVGLAGSFEFEAIRPHVLGSFADLLLAVERHPAMLLYLDQAQSIGPDSPVGRAAARRDKTRGLNENLAREILELHTLGVRSGYGQEDVTELARALTGWSVGGLARQRMLQGPRPGAFFFAEPLHQPGGRTVLGRRYAQPGERQAEAILRDLAVHPSTARHVATKLARHFGGDAPPPGLVARLEAAFLQSGGDLPTVYRALIDAPEPWQGEPKFRTPWDWTLAALRAVGTESLPVRANLNALNQLGQPTWRPGSPAGWDDTAPSWAGPDALYRRIETAEQIARRTPPLDARELAAQLFPGVLSDPTRKALANAESPGQALALLLVAPEMMRR
jgi:uncharacterized protein (DUF1800 family)